MRGYWMGWNIAQSNSAVNLQELLKIFVDGISVIGVNSFINDTVWYKSS